MKDIIKSFLFASTALAVTLGAVIAMDAPEGEQEDQVNFSAHATSAYLPPQPFSSNNDQSSPANDQSRKRAIELDNEEGEEEEVTQKAKKPRLEDSQVSFEELISQAEAGDPYAQYALARRYAKGKGVERDYNLAFEWYERAAYQGLAEAQAKLASLYKLGIVPHDPYDDTLTIEAMKKNNFGLAFYWYGQAARQGNLKGQSGLALCYMDGIGVTKDVSLGIQLCEKAANQGDWKTQMELYEYYKKSEDYNLAIKWLGKLIHHKNSKRGNYLYFTLGALGDIATDTIKEASELLQPLREMAQTLICENDIGASLNTSQWSLGRTINPGSAALYRELADFGTIILRIIKGFEEPGFMVRFENTLWISWVPDGSLAQETLDISRYPLLQSLICLGKEAVEAGNLLQDLIGDEERPGSAKFKQLRLKVSDELNMSRQSLESLELKRMTLEALIQSCCLPLGNDDDSKRAYQTKLRQIAERYNILESFGDALSGSGSQSMQQVIELRKIRLAEYLDKMVLVEQAIENQKLAHDFLQKQLGMFNQFKQGLQQALYQGINERNKIMRAAYPRFLD